jgi:hypothetical protein
MKKNKKASEINQQTIITILSMVLAVLLLLFAIRACSTFQDKNRKAILLELENGLRSVIDSLSDGQITHKKFILPDGTDTVCFVDLSKKEIVKNTSLARDYPLINQSLNSNDNKNVFLIAKYKVTDALYGGNICFDYYPFYACLAARGNILDVWFEGRAGCATLYINWSSFPDNYKNKTKYFDNPLFLIQERMNSGNIANWKGISSIVPLTLFRERNDKGSYDTYVYNYSVAYRPSGDIDFTNVQYLMGLEKYNTKKSYLFDGSVTATLPYTVETKSTSIPKDHFDFWESYSSLILIDASNYQASVIGSLLAAYVNTPLIFINSSNLDSYKEYILNKQVFVITHGPITLDTPTYDYVRNYASRYQEYSDTLLQSHGEIPAFARLWSNITIG